MAKRQEFMPAPAARRGLGIDTTHTAFGVLGQGDGDADTGVIETRLSEDNFQRICRQLMKLKNKLSGLPDAAGHKFSWDVVGHERHGLAVLIDFDVRFTIDGKDETGGSPIEALTMVIGVTLATGHRTMITIEMRHDTNRAC